MGEFCRNNIINRLHVMVNRTVSRQEWMTRYVQTLRALEALLHFYAQAIKHGMRRDTDIEIQVIQNFNLWNQAFVKIQFVMKLLIDWISNKCTEKDKKA